MTPEQMLARALAKIAATDATIAGRRAWYEGNHPSDLGSEGWNRTYRDKVRRIIDNQCHLVVNRRAGVLLPQTFTSRTPGVIAEANAEWVTTRIREESDKLLDALRVAKWSGVPTAVFVDYNSDLDVALFPLSPDKSWVEVDRGGTFRWLFFLWRDEEDFICGTLVTRDGLELVYKTSAKLGWPSAGEYRLTDERRNGLGDVPVIVFDDGGSIIDEIWPINSLLNSSLQTQHVVEEKAATPSRVWWGLQVVDPRTGKLIENLTPNVNPATGSSDIGIPTVKDSTMNADRRVEQLDNRSPQDWTGIQDEHRLSICRLGSIPAFMAQVGSQALSGDALEIAYMPFVTVAEEDRRRYTRAMNRLARLMVSRRMVRLTGRPSTDQFDVTFSTIDTTTKTSRFTQFAQAVTAGMAISDAAIQCLGASREEADELAANSEAVIARSAAMAGAQFLAGV